MRESDRERAATEQQAAADFLDLAHDTAGLWRECADKVCRRMRTCAGDADVCGARCFPEGWAWVQALLRALRDGRPLRDAMCVADRQVVAGEQAGAFGQRPRKIIVHYPGLGESFELVVDPAAERRRRRPSVGPQGRSSRPSSRAMRESVPTPEPHGRRLDPPPPPPAHRPLAPTHGVGHSRGRAKQAIPRRS